MNIVSSQTAFWVEYGRECGIEALRELMKDCAEAMICGRPVEVSYEGARGKVEYPGNAAFCGTEIAEAIRILEGGASAFSSHIDLSCRAART